MPTSFVRILVSASSATASRATPRNITDCRWSKALDTTDCCSGNIYNFYPNSQNASLEWGRSSMDAEHNLIANYIWEIPFLRGRHDLAGQVFGGWQLSGITIFQSGLPFD